MSSASPRQQTQGLWLGLLGVAIFAMTLPMTRLAVGPASAPQLRPAFVTAGRAALAGLLSLAWLASSGPGAWRLDRRHLPALVVSAIGTVLGYPLCLALALREVDAMHAAVVSGLIPIVTASAAALHFRQRPSLGFWICALVGCGLVLAFAVQQGSGRLSAGDAWLLLAILSTSIGYVAGAHVGASLPGERVICWVLVVSLPFALPLALLTWPTAPARAASWGGFAYVTVFSMWLGFFAWYRGMALGGAVRVSQVQLVQPFLAVLFAVPVLGEPLEPRTLVYSLAVIAVVFIGRRMAVAVPSSARPTVPRRS